MVREIVELRAMEGYINPEEEKLDLARMDTEAQELISLAKALVQKAKDGFLAVKRQHSIQGKDKKMREGEGGGEGGGEGEDVLAIKVEGEKVRELCAIVYVSLECRV